MSKLRIRSAEERDLLRWAKAHGWSVVRRNGVGHMLLQHSNGATASVPGKLPGGHLAAAIRAQLNKKAAREALNAKQS